VRVYCATFYNETNTFSPLLTGREDFVPMALAQAGTPSFAAAFAPVRELGGEVVGSFNRAAHPGGMILRTAYESLRDELLQDLASRLPVDLVTLNLHGAMVADGYDDCEGDVLAKIRILAGGATPIVASLDPHAHLSAGMLANADVLVAYREYPHTDEAATFSEVVRLGVASALHRIRPCMTASRCGQIAEYHTTQEPMRSVVADMRAWERLSGVLAVSLIHGFPWGDVSDLGTQSLVITDDDPALGRKLADDLAARIRAVRGRSSNRVFPFEEALAQARAAKGPVVVADVSDNPGGGAAGDSTFLLGSLLGGTESAAFGPLWDPFAVSLARKAGPGSRVSVRLGGKTAVTSGSPIDIEGLVIATSERLKTEGVGGYEVSYGPSASLRVGSLEIVVTTEREQAMSPTMFTKLGIDLHNKQIIVVKSAQHFRALYQPIAREIIYASSPGTLNLDFASLPYRAADRGIWPLTR
jgi:microcystin degradation protein MlrC